MAFFDNIAAATVEIFAWQNLIALLAGTVGGIVIGALPGLTASMGIAVLIPLTFTMEPLVALGMVAGIYNGAMYGGAIPAILLSIPGTPSAIATTFDGYPLAQKGEAENALLISVWSSAIGGIVSGLVLLFLAPLLGQVTLLFGPAEYFWVAVFGLASISVLLGASPTKGLMAACIGLLIGTIGIDIVTGQERFTFNSMYLTGGFNFVVLLAGLYGIPPAIEMAERAIGQTIDSKSLQIGKSTRKFREWRSLFVTWARSSVIGVIIGILPGAGGSMAAFISYNEEKRAAKDPETFGHGNYKGLAAAECGNNADSAASLIPTLTLGVPGSSVAAVIMGAFLVHGMQPGAGLFRTEPVLVYGFMLQMILGAIILPIVGALVFVRVFAMVLRLPNALIAPLVVALSVIGVYSIQNSMFDVYALLGFGLFGYLLRKLEFPVAPVVLGLILGPMAEQQLRIAMIIAQGNYLSIGSSPISLIIIALTLVVLAFPVVRYVMSRRSAAMDANPKEEHA